MVTKRRYLDLHKGVKRQRIQNVVQFGRAFHLEDADVRVLPCDAPQMQPLALLLELLRTLVLLLAQVFDLFRVRIMRNPDGNLHMEQHVNPHKCALVQVPDTGLRPVILCNKTSAYSDAADWSWPVINLPSMTTFGVYGFVLV